MTWSEWADMAAAARGARQRAGLGAGLDGISPASLCRYEQGDCPRRDRLEVWARALGLDVEEAVAAWRGRYEVGIVADCAARRADMSWRRGVKGALGLAAPASDPVSVWAEGDGYAGRIGRSRCVRRGTLHEVLDALLPEVG